MPNPRRHAKTLPHAARLRLATTGVWLLDWGAMLVASALLASLLSAAAPLTVVAHIAGPLETSVSAAAGRDGPALAAQMARLLRWRGDPARNLHRGDVALIMYEPGETPELVALSYKGLEVNLRAYRFDDGDGVARFFDESGRRVEPKLENSPVPRYVQITELVQSGRGKRRHHGLDLKAPIGTPVVLPFAGVVTRVNWSTRVNGKCVEVQLDDGRITRFLHLDSVASSVRPGARLAAGAPIGELGNTGRSSAPHLHYEVRGRDGEPLAPERVHGTSVAHLATTLRPRFDAERLAHDRRFLAVEPAGLASAASATGSAGH